MANCLIEIPRSEWICLRDMYLVLKRFPSAYGLLQNYISWITKDSECDVKIYSLNGDWKNDGTFILIDFDMEMPHIFFNTLSEDLKIIKIGLNCLTIKPNYLLSTVPQRIMSALTHHVQSNVLNVSNRISYAGVWYHISKEDALKFNIDPPENITLSSLKMEHANFINNLWPHRGPNTIKYIERLIRFNDNVGAFNKNGDLIAWCLRTPVGALGSIQVVELYKRQGLGSLVVRYMAKKLAFKNEEITAPVVYENFSSKSMFERLGFKVIDEACCVVVSKESNNDKGRA